MFVHSLITGPPASGKSRAALEVFLGDPGATLLTPTATMAEHVRNELARSGFPIRPNRILTLAKFIEPFTELQEASPSLLYLLIAQQHPDEFPGYHRALAALIEEGAPIPPELENQLQLRGRALRAQRLRSANPTAAGPVILDGFFSFSLSELEMIEKLAAQTSVTITLPDTSDAKPRLIALGFSERNLGRSFRHADRTVFAALSMEQEVEQIAKRVLDYSAQGREFREMGILLRAREPYAAALETTLARFGIPARFHFTHAVASHPAVQFISGMIGASLHGWDHTDLLTLLRMPVSGVNNDALDFKLRDSLPAAGLTAFLESPTGVGDFAGGHYLRRLAGWKPIHQLPTAWSASLKTLRAMIPASEISDRVSLDQLQIWRSTAAALDAFDAALDDTALALPAVEVSLSVFGPMPNRPSRSKSYEFRTAGATWSTFLMSSKLANGNCRLPSSADSPNVTSRNTTAKVLS